MKIFFILFMALIGFRCFSQKSDADTAIKNKILNIYKEVKVVDENARFVMHFTAVECAYQILINDVPVVNANPVGSKGKTVGSNAVEFIISEYILQSGKQEIAIRLFPRLKEDFTRDSFLNSRSSINVMIDEEKFELARESEYKELYQFETPEISQENIPYLEFKGHFMATLPQARALAGWEQGTDLAKENKTVLLKEAVEKYEEFRQSLASKDTAHLARLLYLSELDFSKARHLNGQKDSEDSWKKMTAMIKGTEQVLPLEHYQLVLYGRGRVAALEKTEAKYERKPAVIRKTVFGDLKPYSFYLYRPKPGAPLEIIR